MKTVVCSIKFGTLAFDAPSIEYWFLMVISLCDGPPITLLLTQPICWKSVDRDATLVPYFQVFLFPWVQDTSKLQLTGQPSPSSHWILIFGGDFAVWVATYHCASNAACVLKEYRDATLVAYFQAFCSREFLTRLSSSWLDIPSSSSLNIDSWWWFRCVMGHLSFCF